MSNNDPSQKAKSLSARLMAVQALYQNRSNPKPVKALYQEYMDHRVGEAIGGHALVEPDGALLKLILFGVEERHAELKSVISANLNRDAGDRVVEPLLESILYCGAYEILVQTDIDAPILINDYLNVGHAFFDKNEVALINGVLDSVAKVFR